jgi:hypothetical protein
MLDAVAIDESAARARQWRVDPRLAVAKLVVVTAAVITTVMLARAGDRPGWVLGGAVSLAAAGYALRDLMAPVRLSADQQGLTVRHGFAARAHLSWTEVERIRVDQRSRLGIPAEALEIDAGEQLFLLGRGDLGAAPTEVAQVLAQLSGAARPI